MTDDTTCVQLPKGEYAIVEQLGHRTFVGRVEEIERFGAKMLQVEPIYQGALLGPILLGGSTLFAFTPCSPEVAAAKGAKYDYQLTASVRATLPALALPAPDPAGCTCEPGVADDPECAVCFPDAEPEFAPAFLSDE